MSALDALNVATRDYINQSCKKLVDSLFQEDPLIKWVKRRVTKQQLQDATGCSEAEADVASEVAKRMAGMPRSVSSDLDYEDLEDAYQAASQLLP